MDAEKRKRYENIAGDLVRLAGGRDNILGIAHCATRLRLVLEDNDKADIKKIEDVDLVKGVFVAGDQLQIIFGAGLVNDVCQVLAESLHMDSMSLGDLKTKANKRMNPLMSVAIIAQGGAVLGYLARNRKEAKARELCIPSFVSVLFGITEPALFGVNLRYRYPLIGGCIGGAIGGVIVYVTNLAALGFGTTVVPGIALADPADNGYVSYIIAHTAALGAGFLFAFLLGAAFDRKKETVTSIPEKSTEEISHQGNLPEEIDAFVSGECMGIEEVNDPTFAQKVLGDGVAILPEEGKVFAPADCTVEMVTDTKHAVGLRTKAGNGILIHVGIDTVNLAGKYFDLCAKEGQELKAGDCILEFDKEKIAAEGYDTTVCMVFTELPEGVHIQRTKEGRVSVGEKIAEIVR